MCPARGVYSGYRSYTKYDENDRFLEPEDDAARVHLGGAWCIPSRDQVDELIKNTTWEQKEINGYKGVVVESIINHNTIFLPYGGYQKGIYLWAVGEAFDYHTSEAYDAKKSWYWYFGNDWSPELDYYSRYSSCCIRAVIPGDQSVSPAAQVRSLGPVGFGHKAKIEQQRQQQEQQERDPKARRSHKRALR